MTGVDDEGQAYDAEAEVALLAACYGRKDNRITARRFIAGGDFYQPAHEALYGLLGQLDRHGKAVDVVTVFAAIDAAGLNPGMVTRLREIVGVLGSHASSFVADEDTIRDYCHIVAGWALRRRLAGAGRALVADAMNPTTQPAQLASRAVTTLTGIRDAGAGDITAKTLDELLAGMDEAPRWVIPDLMEAGDRLLLTGTEGAGKSNLERQIAVMASAGIHPFTEAVMPPIRSLILDVENKEAQVRRQVRPLYDWLARQPGASNPSGRVMIDAGPRRWDITADRDLAKIHQVIDAWQPALVIIGPLYRLYPRSLNTDDDAHPVLAALDTIIERGCALVVEAHAGHTAEQQGRGQSARNLRPRGSAALLGWPEFGLGLRGYANGIAELEPWRGHREARAWPTRLRRSPGNRWSETSPDDRGSEPPREPLPVGVADHERGVQGTLV